MVCDVCGDTQAPLHQLGEWSACVSCKAMMPNPIVLLVANLRALRLAKWDRGVTAGLDGGCCIREAVRGSPCRPDEDRCAVCQIDYLTARDEHGK